LATNTGKNITVAIIAVFVLAVISFLLGLQIVTTPSLTAYATNNATGMVNITILNVLSIHLDDDVINLGTCEINTTRGYALISSEGNSSAYNNADCFTADFPDVFVVENDGTWPTNITMMITTTPNDFFGESSGWIAYHAINWTSCMAGLQDSYMNMTLNNTQYPLCDYLNSTETQDLFNISLLMKIPANATARSSLGFVLTARPIN